MNKTYGRINWENYPSDETPLNESNLNKIDVATDEIDNRVITLDTTKATKEEVSTLVQDVTFEEKTGIITIVKKNGSKVTIDTQMEKIAVNFSYNAGTQQIILTLIDGTKQYIDLSALITQYEFLDSDTVAFSIDSTGKVSAIVKEASIQEKHLQPNYLADIKVEVAKAQASQSAAAKSESNAKASETAAATSESNAAASATKAQSYAVGGTNSRTGEDTDNAKYYSQQSAQSQSAAATSADTANTKAEEAAASATTAKTSADNAAGSANVASEKANNAANSATIAVSNSNAAQQYASNAATSANTAQNYAVADTDSAKYYYEQARRISESFSGALRPMGTVTFANLPALSEAAGGSMYNISDEFVTTSDFKEGAGNTIPAGANVYKTEDGKWDVLAGTPVTGVKGSAESSYRRGNVNVTAENVGALSLKNGGDVTGDTSFQGKRRVHYVDDGTGRAGYDKIARFTANNNYNNAAIEIELARRTDTVPTRVAIMFASNACYAVTCMGHTKDIYMCKESDGVWVLCVKKTHEWCTTSVLDYVHSSFADGVNVEWIISSNQSYLDSLPGTEVISGTWGYIVKEAIEAGNVNWNGVTDKPSTYPPSDGSGYYVKNESLSNVNLDDVVTTGIYHLTGNNSNMPLSCNATLIVDFNVGTPYQIFIPDYAYVMYKRTYSNSSWSAWNNFCDGSIYKHGLLDTDFTCVLPNDSTSTFSALNSNGATTGFFLKSIRGQYNAPSWFEGNYASGIAFGGADTHAVISCRYEFPRVTFCGGNGTEPNWWMRIAGTSGHSYNLNDFITTSGTTSLAGSIVPSEDVGMELGDETHRFTNVYSKKIYTGAVYMERSNHSNAIYESGNDSANGNGGGLNNLVIQSWWGVSFTSNCGTGRYGGKNQTAVGIDCREGVVRAYNFEGLINGHSVNADVPSDAKFTDTKGRYIGTTVTKPQDKTEMYITYLSSGYIVMAGKTASKSYAMNTQYGNAFWAPFTIYLPPNIVKNIDSVNITPFAETGLISASINGYTSEQITGFVWSPQNETKSISFHVTVHGRA